MSAHDPFYQSLYQSLLGYLKANELSHWAKQLPEQIADGLSEQRYGDLPRWRKALEQLPITSPSTIELQQQVSIGLGSDLDSDTCQHLDQQLRALIPWRKGPMTIHGIHIDTEWRSDWKWDRLLPHIGSLQDKTLLDVGCGNGYHCLRAYGEGASRVMGIDPSPRFIIQFYMMKHFLGDIPVDVLPIGIEGAPADLQHFDTTLSMGVLYHRRSPMDHLRELKATLKPGGQLILETLIIDGALGEVLVPEGRYAMMNNVWFLPSAETLISWLRKCGFHNPRLVDTNQTSINEQRQTQWMTFYSLNEYLDPNDPNKTVEGHPAPLRGIFLAEV